MRAAREQTAQLRPRRATGWGREAEATGGKVREEGGKLPHIRRAQDNVAADADRVLERYAAAG